VSRLCAEIDDKIDAFLNRPLEGDWPYLWLDATYVKVRANGRIVSVAVIVAVAVNSDGRREVLGMAIGASEAETFWTDFLRTLARRGLRGVKLVISDAHEGLKAAVARVLHASWQRCRVHFMRNVLAHAGKQGRRVVAAFIATALAQEDAELARLQWRQVADQLRPKVAKLAALMDAAEADVLAFISFPKSLPSRKRGITGPRSTAPIRWNALMARSSAAPTSLASSPTRTPSPAWSARSCSSRTMNGRCSVPAT
jgi:transposase-like protein